MDASGKEAPGICELVWLFFFVLSNNLKKTKDFFNFWWEIWIEWWIRSEAYFVLMIVGGGKDI